MCCFHAGVRLPQLAQRTQRLEHGTTQAPVKNEQYENVEIVLPEGIQEEGVAAREVTIPPLYSLIGALQHTRKGGGRMMTSRAATTPAWLPSGCTMFDIVVSRSLCSWWRCALLHSLRALRQAWKAHISMPTTVSPTNAEETPIRVHFITAGTGTAVGRYACHKHTPM